MYLSSAPWLSPISLFEIQNNLPRTIDPLVSPVIYASDCFGNAHIARANARNTVRRALTNQMKLCEVSVSLGDSAYFTSSANRIRPESDGASRSAKLKTCPTPYIPSLLPQSDQRIHPQGPASRNIGRRHRDYSQSESHDSECRGVHSAH